MIKSTSSKKPVQSTYCLVKTKNSILEVQMSNIKDKVVIITGAGSGIGESHTINKMVVHAMVQDF